MGIYSVLMSRTQFYKQFYKISTISTKSQRVNKACGERKRAALWVDMGGCIGEDKDSEQAK